MAAHVRGHHHVAEGFKSVRDLGFVIEYIETGAGDPAAGECCDQGVGVYDAAAEGVGARKSATKSAMVVSIS